MSSNLRMTDNSSSLIDANDVLSSSYSAIQGNHFLISLSMFHQIFEALNRASYFKCHMLNHCKYQQGLI